MNIYHSIHTMTLQRKILLEKVSSYRSLLYGLSDRYGTGSYRKSENEYYFYMYTPQGVIISLRGRTKLRFYQINNQSQFAALYGDTESSIIQPVPRLYENTGLQSARYTAGCTARRTGDLHVCAGGFQCERPNAGPARIYCASAQRRCAERLQADLSAV